jgi:hypothetical protein
MQISIDTDTLETILAHSVTAAHLASKLDHTVVTEELTKSVHEIGNIIEKLLSWPYIPRQTEKPGQMGKPEFSVANAVDDLRQLVARVDALANAAENLLDGVFWVDHGVDSIKFDRLAHLVGATTDAVQTVMEAGDWLAAELSARRTGD